MENPGGSAAASVDPTVLDLLRASSLAPMLDQPVSQVLSSMGLPQLPQLPEFIQLPDMPPLPTIDLTALMQPLTELASAFGSGDLGGTISDGISSINPADALSTITSVLETTMSLGSTALQAVMQLWQSDAATDATVKATSAAANGAELATQSTAEKGVLTHGAGNVAVGTSLMTALIARFSASLAVLVPLAGTTPGGQAALIAATVEAVTEGLGITAETKAEMVMRAVEMTQAGEKVPVTNAPSGVESSTESLSQLMSLVSPLMSAASTAVSSISSLAEQVSSLSTSTTDDTTTTTGDTTTTDTDLTDAETTENLAAAGGGGGVIGGVGAIGGAGAASTSLSPWQGRSAGLGGAGGLGGVSGGTAGGASVTTASATGSSPGYMPMGGAAGAAGAPMARAVDGGGNEAVHSQLVTGNHGDEVVGQLDGVATPVVGAVESVSTEAPPDKELSL
ncbi:hypothetical protein ACFXK0_05095 [Nocardia sp. NPDC059177]|uniref:hypothetical protein n=1 Tax=Nocardia sp. NPDC059177 TaxID=3346759 RepID=UPI0036CDAD50